MAAGSCVSQMAQRLSSHSLAGCRPIECADTFLSAPSRPSSSFLFPALPKQELLFNSFPGVGWRLRPIALQSLGGNGRQSARTAPSRCLASTYSKLAQSHIGRGPHLTDFGCRKAPKDERRRSTLVRASGGDFEFDGDDDDGDGGGLMDDDGLGDEIEFDFDAPDNDGDDGDAYVDDDDANLEDDDFEIEDFEVLAQETIDVEDLDDLMAEGLGDTSKVRRVPFKIDEDHYLKLQCRKPPFDFFIRRNEQGFLNLSQVYGGEPYSERYVIPSMKGELPNEFHRYQTLSWHSVNTADYDEDEYASRHPVSGDKTLRWYVCRTFEDRDLMSDPLACLMTEQVWKLDAKTRSVEKVDVKMEVTLGDDRVRRSEVLIIKPDGVVAQNAWDVPSPSTIVASEMRRKQLLRIEGYLQVFRDYDWEGLRPIWEQNLRDPSKVIVTPELIQSLIDEGRLRDTPQLWSQLKLERPKEKVPQLGTVQLPTQRFKRK